MEQAGDVCDPTGGTPGCAIGIYQTIVGLIGGGLGAPAVAIAAKHSVTSAGGPGLALSEFARAGFMISTLIFWSRRRAFARASLAIVGTTSLSEHSY